MLRIAVSQLNGNKMDLNGSASWVVANFTDKRDLKSILTSTDYIPCFSGGQPGLLSCLPLVCQQAFSNCPAGTAPVRGSPVGLCCACACSLCRQHHVYHLPQPARD